MVVERRLSLLIAVTIVFVVMAVLWDLFRPSSRPSRALQRPVAATPGIERDPAGRGPVRRQPAGAPLIEPPPSSPPAESGPSYMVLLARSQARRRIRSSAGLTYLNEIVSGDSMLHRWDNRVQRPVRVFLRADTVANFQASFLDAVRQALQRWEQVGIGVRFNPDADSASAEVYVRWRQRFGIERTGQTNLTWDQDGHLVSGVVTLATFDPAGRPLGPDDVRVVALHEIGHLIGLDHSSDSTDVMHAKTKVRDLSQRDIASALLLYELAPGSLR
jgi:hypothetical protein